MPISRVVRALAAATLVPAAIFSAPAPAALADGCPDVELVFARGTGEPPGLGRVGDALFADLQGALGGRSVGAYGVNYPASFNFLTAADGANDARNHIAWMADNCPGTRIALGGFSQGAAVVSMLAGVSPVDARLGAWGQAPPLDPVLADRVAAVAVFGNPGVEQGRPLTTTGMFAGRAMDVCNPGDPFCAGGRDVAAHRTYELGPSPMNAAQFIAGRV